MIERIAVQQHCIKLDFIRRNPRANLGGGESLPSSTVEFSFFSFFFFRFEIGRAQLCDRGLGEQMARDNTSNELQPRSPDWSASGLWLAS